MDDAWLRFWGPDPRPWLRTSREPSTRWRCLAELDGASAAQVQQARRAAVADGAVGRLIERLPDWRAGLGGAGHESPTCGPNLLNLLAELGVAAGDDGRVERLLEEMLEQQDEAGRFLSFGPAPGRTTPTWGAVACDTHAVTEVLVRFGRADDPRVERALEYMGATLSTTPQGAGWECTPHTVTGWRGPGRRRDLCPKVTLEALRTFARLPEDRRPAGLTEAARTPLEVWRRRSSEHPHMFGHGVGFKTIKWPPVWYGVWMVLDTVGRYPQLWSPSSAAVEDRRSVAELVACLTAYNTAADGTVTPSSCYRGFGDFSFGRKQQPSPIATAMTAGVARRFSAIAADVEAIDALALASSRGSPQPVGPRR